MMDLMESWGYAPLLPSQLPAFPPVHYAVHFMLGLIILGAGNKCFLEYVVSIRRHEEWKERSLAPWYGLI